MKLTIENIGAIKKAEITIDKLTVIAGENSSGKTTIGKVLYAQIKSFGNIAKTTGQLFVREAINKKIVELHQVKKFDATDLPRSGDIDTLLAFFKDKLDKEEYAGLEEVFTKYADSVNTTEGFETLRTILYTLYTTVEFDGQVDSYDKNSDIKTSLDKCSDKVNNVLFMSQSNDFIDFANKARFTYNKSFALKNSNIDSELDNIESNIILTHQEDFIKFINTKETIFNPVLLETDYKKENDELTRIKEEFKALMNGDFSYSEKEKRITYKFNGVEIKPTNTANGLKTIGYFSQILRLEFLMSNNLLILDEPEISLHPIWQVKFAKILVELAKIFNVKIVIISHSPYFIDAINKFSEKYTISPSFYLLEGDAKFTAKDVTDKVHLIMEALDAGYDYIDINTLHRDDKE